MADNPQLAVLTHANYVKDVISDGVLETNIALMELKSRAKIKYNVGGTSLIGVARTDSHSISGWGPMQVQNTAQPNLHNQWSHNWGGLYADYFLDEWDRLSNKGPQALFSMQEEYLESLREDMDEYMEDSIFLDRTSLTPRQIGGFAAFIKKTGTYGGLTQVSGSTIGNAWKSQIINGATAVGVYASYAATADNIDGCKAYVTYMLNQCTRGKSRGKSGRPQSAFCDRANWNYFHNSIESQRRVVSNEKKLSLGHTNFLWDGCEFFWSDSAPAQRIDFINWDVIELWCAGPQMFMSNSDTVVQPVKGQVHQLYSKLQMVCRNPRMCGAISGTNIT